MARKRQGDDEDYGNFRKRMGLPLDDLTDTHPAECYCNECTGRETPKASEPKPGPSRSTNKRALEKAANATGQTKLQLVKKSKVNFHAKAQTERNVQSKLTKYGFPKQTVISGPKPYVDPKPIQSKINFRYEELGSN